MNLNSFRIAIVTNIPAPYRIPVIQRISEMLGYHNIHIIYCSEKEDNRQWKIEQSGFLFTILKKKYLTWKGRFIHYNPDVVKALRQFNPDIIITTGFNPTHLLAFAYTIFLNKVHIPMTDGTFDSEQHLSTMHRLIRSIVYRHSNVFIGASLGSFRLYNDYGISSERIFQSHLCANNAAFQPQAIGNRTFDLMFSGRFAAEKNPLFALKVAAGVAKALNRKISFLMLGSGPLAGSVLKFVSTLTDEVEVILLGFKQQDQLPELYCSAKIFLFPSSGEPWGVVVNEACAAGQAVILSPYAGSANELVCHGENGYVLPLDLELWIKHAVTLLSNESLLEQFSKNSLMKVLPYNYDAAAKGIFDAVLSATESL